MALEPNLLNPAAANPPGSDPAKPAEPASAPAGGSPQTHTIKVNGQERVVTADELVKLAQKGAAADEKFQEAARIREESERDRRVAGAFRQLRKGGFEEDAFRTVAEDIGLAGDELEQVIAELKGQAGAPAAKGQAATQPSSSPPVRPEKVDFSHLDRELQDFMVAVEKERTDRALREAIEKDEVLGYTVQKRPQTLEYLVSEAKKALKGRVAEARGRVADKAQLYADVVGDLRTMLKQLGTVFGSTSVGLGPASSTDGPDLHPAKQPTRVSVTSPEYETNLSTRLEWLMHKLAAEGR